MTILQSLFCFTNTIYIHIVFELIALMSQNLLIFSVSANRPEFVRIQQQLEGETYPPDKWNPNGPPRAFYQLSRDEKAAAEKKRLVEYCKKSYKKVSVQAVPTSAQKLRDFRIYGDMHSVNRLLGYCCHSYWNFVLST